MDEYLCTRPKLLAGVRVRVSPDFRNKNYSFYEMFGWPHMIFINCDFFFWVYCS